MHRLREPDYENCLVNLTASIHRYFGCPSPHPGLPLLDRYLSERSYKNVVLMIFDGLGVRQLADHLPAESFLRRNCAAALLSVFPPTTTAAITSFESGLTPYEHGWLGWDLYFAELDKIVTPFTNNLKDSSLAAADFPVAQRFLPLARFQSLIHEAGLARAYNVSPFGSEKVETEEALYPTIARLCAQAGRKFIYSYWYEPDGLMHQKGSQSAKVRQFIRNIDVRVAALASELQDSLLIVTADHGHADIKNLVLEDYPELVECLERSFAIEGRAATFYVKKGREQRFESEFRARFGAWFRLLTRAEVLEQKLFGNGRPAPGMDSLLGDYLAVATDEYCLVWSHKAHQWKSHHGGLRAAEMEIPLILWSC